MALKFRLHGTALAAALAFGFLGSAHAQFGGNTCVSLVTANQAMPAPATGTMSITNLDKYGVPAQACTNMTLNGTTSMNFEMTIATALRYNNVTMPACQGLAFGLNGGPVYSYTRANGSFALTGSMTGTFNMDALSQIDNLTVSLGGQNYTVNAGVSQFKARVVMNADGTQDVTMCMPAGGVPASINGSTMGVPAAIWQCVSPQSDPKVRVRYVDVCPF